MIFPQILHLCWINVVTDMIVVPTTISLVAAFPFASSATFFRESLVFVLFPILIIGCKILTLQYLVRDCNVVEIKKIGQDMVTLSRPQQRHMYG